MPKDPNADPDPAPDPSEDTPADGGDDQAADNQGSTVDWEAKYREAQKLIARQGQELGIYRSATDDESSEDEAADDEPEEPEPAPAGSERLIQDSWDKAEQVYGEDALAAYVPAAKLLRRAETPADYVAAFEAYHQARLGGKQPKAAAAAAQAQGDQAPQPRVESNRPDATPDLTEIDRKAEAAKAKGDLRGFLVSQIERVGIR